MSRRAIRALRSTRLRSHTMRPLVTCLLVMLVAAGVSLAQQPGFEWQIPAPFPKPWVPPDNPMSRPKVELGRRLFYDTRLSVNGRQSCASCHRQELAFTDSRARGVGTTGEMHPRGSMSLANVAYNPSLTWADPETTALEQQAMVPMFGTVPVELGLHGADARIQRDVERDSVYARLFPQAFPGERAPYTIAHIVKAIAAFERTLISLDSPYDRYRFRNEPNAISESAKRGETFFFSGQRGGCFQCHGGWNFNGDVSYDARPRPRVAYFNTGLYNLSGDMSYPRANTGVHAHTGRREDIGKFRVPTLRNIAVTAPYMHDGSIATLSEVIDHYAAGGRTIASGANAGIGRDNPNKAPSVHGFAITPEEKRDLIAFLETLTDSAFLRNPAHANPWVGARAARSTGSTRSTPGRVVSIDSAPGAAARAPVPLPLVPMPATVVVRTGEWRPDERVRRLLSDVAALNRSRDDTLATAGVRRRIQAGTVAESYRLRITPRGAELTASDSAGLFYGSHTLHQLVAAAPTVRAMTIDDAPRFRYRGMHLDVARHFMPVDFVKRYVDLMSRYKFNTFHWHLTDDQGWRIEITKYPRLTEIGGCRAETMVAKNFNPYVGDGIRHCGSYTQAEIRDVIAYAARRHVTIVPEIEMPGHAKAALAAYPELACTPGPFTTRTTWGVDEDVFCPSDRTFQFLDDVLGEVASLFPGRYIHIGGDETPKTRWRASATAGDVMRRENLASPEALQSWFIRRVERMLIARGKRLIGWDEILEGGLAPEATVMSWRGSAGGVAAAREGHDVIMTPNSHLYFDSYQGNPANEPLAIGGLTTLRRVYDFDPVPDSLTPAQARHVLGAQANLWTEYLETPSAVEYMAYPRALALAEVLWSPRAARVWPSFAERLPSALRSLDRLGVGYRVPDVDGLAGDRLTLDSTVVITLASGADGEIRYTTDGSAPTNTSTLYRAPFTLRVDTAVSLATRVSARVFASNGRVSAPSSASFVRTSFVAADASIDPGMLQSGLRYEYFDANVRSTRALDTLRAARSGTITRVGRRGDETGERYGLVLRGVFRVPADALYEFALTSDDGSRLTIADRAVIDHDGLHGAEEKTGMIALRRGAHPFVVHYFQGGGGAALSLRYRVGNGAWSAIPAEWLGH